MEDAFSGILARALKLADSDESVQPLVFAAWTRACGDAIVKHAVPARYFKNKLYVAVEDAVWMKHLKSLADQMVYRLNSSIGRSVVKRIEFEVDAKKFGAKKRGNSRFSPSAAKREIDNDLRVAAENITDENLRSLFLGAAGNCLLREKHFYSKK